MPYNNAVQMIRDIANGVAKYGVNIVWAPGWENRGNGSQWAPGGPKGFVNHHTAGGNNIYLDQNLISGVPGLSGPLCNFAGLYDGDLAVVAAYPANHAGASGGWDTAPLPVTGWFNQQVLGIEMQYNGISRMPPEQYRTMTIVNKVAQEVLGWPVSQICSKNHQGTSIEGKWDMGYDRRGYTYDIAQIRRDIAAVRLPNQAEEELMASFSDAEKNELLVGIRQFNRAYDTQAGPKWVGEMVVDLYNEIVVPKVSLVDQRAGKPLDKSYTNPVGSYIREADAKLENMNLKLLPEILAELRVLNGKKDK